MKTCIKCGSTEFSIRGDCRPCKRAYDREYRSKKAEQISASKKKCYEQKRDEYIKKSRIYYETNSSIISIKSKIYREKNKDRILLKKAEYRIKNHSSIIESQRKSYFLNKEARLKKAKDYVSRNKDKVADRQKRYYSLNAASAKKRAKEWFENNKERAKARASKYYKNNPEVFHNSRVVRRERESTGRLSGGLVSKLLILQKGLCPCCKKPLGDDYHVDHIIPLALGGKNEDRNIQLLRGSCNMQKHAKHPVDFMQERGFLI